MATTWLITRETDDVVPAGESARGALHVPCVETTLLAWPWAVSADRTLTLFTSPRAVTSWAASGRPALQERAALSPGTTRALEREGVVATVTSETGVVGLAERVRAWWIDQGRPALTLRYPTSNAGLESPEQREALEVLATLGTVDRRVVYRVTAPAGLREALEQATQRDWSISFASPSAIEHFFGASARIERAPTQVACRGASTVRAWNKARPAQWPVAINANDLQNPENQQETPQEKAKS